MCGILVMLCLDDLPDESFLNRATERLAHRGPDDQEILVNECIGLGHRRLRVIDLEGGRQPMYSWDSRYVIVFNGEIYNYIELRNRIRVAGGQFRTNSDTEVILEAYRLFGDSCVNHLRGMFAFVIWDSEQKRLFAARDRLGKKPLFYWWVPGKFLILASEAKAILEHPSFVSRANPEALLFYLGLGYVPEGVCAFESLAKLPPAHTLTVQDGELKRNRYWHWRSDRYHFSTPLEAAETIAHTMEEAVSLRLRSDVPLGAFLSGGIDSSLITALTSNSLQNPIKTFSVKFPFADETHYARMVAGQYGTEHHEITVVPELVDIITTIGALYDEPFGDSSAIPVYLLSKFCREYVTVVLSGDGGDEVFGGYGWYQDQLRSQKGGQSLLRNNLLYGLVKGRNVLNQFAQLRRWLNPIISRMRIQYRTAIAQEIRHPLLRHKYFTNPPYEPGLDELINQDILPPVNQLDNFYESFPLRNNPVEAVFDFDFAQYLPGDILCKIDMASMAHGLEVRCPMLDQEIVEMALVCPIEWHVSREATKLLLKEIARPLLPQVILNRPKSGLGLPLADWLRAIDVRNYVSASLTINTAPVYQWINHSVAMILLERFYKLGAIHLAQAIWNIIMLNEWAIQHQVTT